MVNFDSIIPGMAAGRYDMTVSSMTPTDKRIAVIDFVDYMQIGNAIVVAKGQPRLTQEALCGRRVGVLIGSYQLTTNIPDYDQKCVAAGRPADRCGPVSRHAAGDLRLDQRTTGRRTGGFADPRIRRNTGSRRRDLGELRLHTRRRRCDQRTPAGERRRGGSRHRHHQWRLPRSARRSTDWIPRPSPRPASTRLNEETIMPPVISEAPEASSPPSESHVDDSIPVVPLRHPIRNAAAILLLVARWRRGVERRDQPQIRMGRRSDLPVVSRDTAWCAADRGVDGDLDDRRHRAWHRSRGHAHLRQPHCQPDQPRVHLVLPGHPAAGAADLLVQHRRPVPDRVDRASVRRSATSCWDPPTR